MGQIRLNGSALLTNGESHVALAVARSLGKKGIKVTAGSSTPDGMVFHSKYCKAKFNYPSPPADEDGFIRSLADEASKGCYDVLFACDADTFMPVSKHRDKLTPHLNVPMPSHETMERANDKAKLVEAAMKAGVPCPKTIFNLESVTPSEAGEELGFPVVIKPNVSSGSTGLVYAGSAEELQKAYESILGSHGSAILQEYVSGPKYGFSALFNKDSEPRRACVYRHIREYPITGGPMCAGETVHNPDVLNAGLNLLKAYRWYGVANMEFIVDERDGKPKVLDFNPRFFAGLSLALAAGVDYPHLLYKIATEGDIPANLGYKVGVLGRHLILDDSRHMINVLKGAKTPKYETGRLRTALNYLKFHEYNTDYIISLDDPAPAMHELLELTRRKTGRNTGGGR